MPDLVLQPVTALIIFVVACLAGHRYRYVWKEEGPSWQLWLFGVVSAAALLALGLIPMAS